MHHHKWNIEYIDNLMPWEKEVYISMLVNFLEEEAKIDAMLTPELAEILIKVVGDVSFLVEVRDNKSNNG